MLGRIALVTWVWCGCSIVLGLPLAQHVPADAVVYVGWAGTENVQGMAQTHLQGIITASDGAELFSKFLPAVVARVSEDNPAAGKHLEIIASLIPRMWKHASAFYITGVDVSQPGPPQVKMGLSCDAGDDAPEVARDLHELVELAGEQARMGMEVKQDGNLVSLIVNHADATQGTLADGADFKQAMSGVQSDPAAAFYMNIQGVLGAIDQLVEANAPDNSARWKKIENAIGLANVKSFAWSGEFEGADWGTQTFLALPRSEPVGAAAGHSVSDQALKLIPRDASMCTAAQFNAGAFLDHIRSRLAEADPQYQQYYDKGLGVASAMVGIDIKADLIDSLGDQWVTCSAPEIAGNGVLGMVMVNKLTDAAKEEHALESVEIALNNIIAGQIRAPRMTITFRTTEYEGATIHYLAVPLLSPSWTIADGNLYVGLYPQVVAGAIAYERSAGPSILENQQFAEMRTALNGQTPSSISFANIPATIDANYSTWLAMSHYLGLADMFGMPTPPMLMPPLGNLKKNLGPVMTVGYWDQTGWHGRSRSPFPGAMLLGGDPMTMSPIGTSALMVSILLPSLNRARETANRIKCGSNMRQIGQAMLLYSNEHNGHFPADLGSLIMTEEISAQVFVCPSSNTKVSSHLLTLGTDDQAAWVNAHSDYVYLGKGLTTSCAPDTILLYEKDSDHGDGMNILYGDGHVDFVRLAEAHQMIQRQVGK
jgi:prepilin-type processing-associated H-X9-DG protein